MYFVDTNLLVYLHDSKEPEKQEQARRITEMLWIRGLGRLSFQVLHEFYSVATRKLKPGLAKDLARREIEDLMAWNPPPPSAGLFERAWAIEDRWQLSCWDALIVASALSQNCRFLLTEDLSDELQIEGLQVVNPFSKDFDIPIQGSGNK